MRQTLLPIERASRTDSSQSATSKGLRLHVDEGGRVRDDPDVEACRGELRPLGGRQHVHVGVGLRWDLEGVDEVVSVEAVPVGTSCTYTVPAPTPLFVTVIWRVPGFANWPWPVVALPAMLSPRSCFVDVTATFG